MANRIQFQVGFSVDKSGLSQMQSLFQQIVNKAKDPGQQLDQGLKQAAATATTLDQILEKTFNTELGTLNVIKFNQELSKSGLTLKQVQADLSKAGNQGATAYNRLAQAVLGTNLQLKESNKLLDSMATTMANTVKWGITSSIFNTITQSISKAVTYAKQLDTSLNDIRIVTDKSADNMAEFAEQANAAAKEMGASTLDYTNAALIYYQQGLSDEETKARAETTIKAANVTGQTGQEVSEQLTAVWNGYKVTAEETELYVDKLAAVAATTAADLEELSVGMSKVAAAANAMGVNFDDLNAQIATIVSVTRQAPESVGTALKTIYARLGDLKVDGVDEFGVKLGEVSKQMETMGIQILDQNGDLRDMSSVMAEVAEKWDTWTRAQQQAAAIAMAGKRQYNNLVALFENWDMYSDALETSTKAMGTLQHQQDIYMESTAGKLKTLKATWQDLYSGLIDNDELNVGIEGLTNLVQVFDNFIDSFGGGLKSISAFGVIVANIFNKQIADAINGAIQNNKRYQQNIELLEKKQQIIQQGAINSQILTGNTVIDTGITKNTEKQLELAKQIQEVRVGLNTEQYNTLTNYQQEIGALEEEITIQTLLVEEEAKKFAQSSKNVEKTKENVEALSQGVLASSLYDEQFGNILARNSELSDFLTEQSADLKIIGNDTEQISDIAQNIVVKLKEEEESYKNIQSIYSQLTPQEHLILANLNSEDEISKDINLSKKQLEQIIKRIATLSKNQEEITEEEYKQATKIEEKYRNIADLKSRQKGLQFNFNEGIEGSFDSGKIVQQITTVTSALGSMAMAWSSVNSLMQTWSDENTSFGNKITQTFITLGFTLPMLISSFDKLNASLGFTTGLFDGLKAKHAMNNALLKVTTSNTAELTVANQVRAMSEEAIQGILAQETVTEEEKLFIEKLENATTKEQIRLLGILLAEKGENINLTRGEITALQQAKIKQEEYNVSVAKNPYVLVALAIIAVTAAVVKAIDNHYEKEIELADAELKQVKASQEEVSANKELVKSYNDLYDKYQKTGEGKQELFEKTLEIAKAYGIEGAALLALSDDYDTFNKKLLEKQRDETKDSINNAKTGAKDNAIKAIGDASTGTGQRHLDKTYTFNATSLDTRDINQIAQEAIENAGLKAIHTDMTEGSADSVSFSIDIDYTDPEAVYKWKKQIDSMAEYLEARLKPEELNANGFYDEIKAEQLQLANSEGMQELENQINLYYSSLTEKEFLDFQIDNKKIIDDTLSLSELLNIIISIKQELSGKIPENKINSYINNYLSNIQGLSENIAKINFVENISKQTGEMEEEVSKIIETLNNKQIAYLQLHLNELTLDNDLKNWISKKSDELSFMGEAGNQQTLENIINSYKKGKGFNEESIASLFNEEGQSEIIPGLTQESFSAQSEADQINILTNAWIKQTQEVIDHREKIIEQLNKELVSYENLIKSTEQGYDRSNKKLNEYIDSIEEFENKEEEVYNTVLKLSKGNEELSDSEKAYITTLLDKKDIDEEDLKILGQSINSYKKAIEGQKLVTDTLEKIAKASHNHIQNAQNYKAALELYSDELDNIQSAYSSLLSITEDYNKTGAWTIDNVQQLISMDDRYVAALQFENDQLSLNESAVQALTLAKLDQIEADLDAAYQEQMLELAERAVTEAAKASATATANAAGQYAVLGTISEEAAAKVRLLADAMADIDTYGSDAIKAEAAEATKAYENRKKALENAKGEVRKGGSSMRKSMGAGGSSDKGSGSKDKKEEKKLEDEFDRYWQIKKAIDAVDKALNRLEKDKKNLYGTQLIDALKYENELLDKQKGYYEQLIKAQEQEAAELRGQLSTMGIMFDASGAIINYAEATAKALAEYNAAIQQYNAGLIDETTFKVYEKSFENFKKLLSRYDTLYYTEIENTKDKIDDLNRQQLANNLKSWEIKIQLKLDFKELKRGWNDFLKEINEDFQKVYQDLTLSTNKLINNAKTYIGSDGDISTIVNAIHDVTHEIDIMQSGGKSNMFESITQAQEKLKELNDQIQDAAKGLHDLWKEAWQNYLDGIDQVIDHFDDLMEQFDRINDELEFQGELIELLYGEEAYNLLNNLYKGQEKSLENQVKSIKAQVDMWHQLWEESGATMENQADWNEDQKKYYEQWGEAQKNLNDLVIDYIKLLKTDYLNTIQDVLKELEGAITGSSLDRIKIQWERISDYSNKYLDDVEKAYEIQKFSNKINDQILKVDNLKQQQKLTALREKEITYLREKERLTQYDLDAAEARYQIALKEMALEDAQNNKTQMKLVRNEQGNWSYQYVADEMETFAKQQELLDAYNNLYQLANDAYEANLESLQELQEKYLESAKEIYENETLSEEEKEQRLLELREWYFEQYGLLAEENTLYRNDLATSAAALLLEIYEQDQEAYASMTETERELIDSLIQANIEDYMDLEEKIKENLYNINDKSREVMAETRADWKSSAQLLAELWNKDKGGSVRVEVIDAYNRIQKATEDYKNKVDWLAEAVERNFGPEGIEGAIEEASYATDILHDKTVDLVEDGIYYLSYLKDAVDEIADSWRSVQSEINDAISLLEKYISMLSSYNNAVDEHNARIEHAEHADIGIGGTGGAGSGGSGGGSGSGGNTGGNYRIVEVSEPFYRGSTDTFAIKVRSSSGQVREIDLGRNPSPDSNSQYRRYLEFPSVNWDTGGYTGNWNPSESTIGSKAGKLAVLHQKELVLNKEDTANFLQGINTIRDLSNLNGSISNAIMSSVAGMVASMTNPKIRATSGTINNNETNSNENIFNITAEFPNANDVNEIREAIMSLPNLASQYIARNVK